MVMAFFPFVLVVRLLQDTSGAAFIRCGVRALPTHLLAVVASSTLVVLTDVSVVDVVPIQPIGVGVGGSTKETIVLLLLSQSGSGGSAADESGHSCWVGWG
jgi:hypothetical protein